MAEVAWMPEWTHPSVLLLDDGELDAVNTQLERLGADVRRLQGDDIGLRVPCPRDLLVASVQRCLEMPQVDPTPGDDFTPTWVCVHSQDYLPLRERLRDLGVHFLVHSSLAADSLRLFLLQMLYSGPERRSRVRLPVGTEASLVLDGNRKPVRLAELSAESCRIISREEIDDLAPVHLVLSEAVGGGEELGLEGVAIRSASGRSASGDLLFSTVISLEALEPEPRLKLERIVGGGQIGTPVSPLADRGRDADDTDDTPLELARPTTPQQERRDSERLPYERRVEIVELAASMTDGSALGRDLSLTGIRVSGYPEMEPGAHVTLALYGGRREEPVLLRAEVLRGGGAEETAFRFGTLSESQHRGIMKLMAGQPSVASVDPGDRVIVTRIVEPS